MKYQYKKRASKLLILSTALLIMSHGMTSADGMLGTQSESEFKVSVALQDAPKQISISGLSDIMIDKTIGDELSENKEVRACVFLPEGGTYSVEVDAGALVSNSQHYSYKIELSQTKLGAPTLLLPVDSSSAQGEQFGFFGSTVEGCELQPKLIVNIIDVGNDSITSAFTAEAVVKFIVKPE